MAERHYLGIPRSQIPWKPTVDPEKCIGCGVCIDTCPNGVYLMNAETGKAEVVDPDNCVVLCDKCARFCTQEAISFPDKPSTKRLVGKLLQQKGEQDARNRKD